MDCRHFVFDETTIGISELGLGVAALAYARLGHPVLPLVRGGKKPHRMLPENGGVHHASFDESQIKAWWSADPAANIGVATGLTVPWSTGMAVVDLDRKGDGVEQFMAFLRSGPWPLPAGPWVRTPSGGVHIWLAWPPDWGTIGNRTRILPGVDIKGDGGYVVAPPSMLMKAPLLRPGESAADPVPIPYVWDGCPHEAPMAPDWMPGWIASAPSIGTSDPEGTGGADVLDVEDVISAGGFERGTRNAELYRLACSLYRKTGTGPEAAMLVMGSLERVWQAGDTAGMTHRELLVIANSARKFIESAVERDRAVRQSFMTRYGR